MAARDMSGFGRPAAGSSDATARAATADSKDSGRDALVAERAKAVAPKPRRAQPAPAERRQPDAPQAPPVPAPPAPSPVGRSHPPEHDLIDLRRVIPPPPEVSAPPPPGAAGSTTSRPSRSGQGVASVATAEPTTAAPHRPAAPRSPGRTRAKKKRINISLPISLADRLRAHTDRLDTYYLDVIVRAHARHGAEVIAAHQPDPGAEPILRRKRPLGRVQVALTIEPEKLAAIDRDAESARLDRSAFVAEVLQREIRPSRTNRTHAPPEADRTSD